MASTVMASSSSSSSSTASQFLSNGRRTNRPSSLPFVPKFVVLAAQSDSRVTATISNETSLRRRLLHSLPQKAAVIAAAVAAATPLPALAEKMEKAALFDFNLTLPAIAVEFLLLMVALDKLYFTPLGKFMDERDAAIRAKLGDVKDTSEDVKQLEEQGAAVMMAARAEITAALNKMKKETSAELEQKLAEGRKRVEAELAEALQNLEKQKEDTIKALDSQIAALSDEIVKKVLPTA